MSLSLSTPSWPDTYSAHFFGAEAANDCTPSVQNTAIEVVAHPAAADVGECIEWAGPVLGSDELWELALATRSENGAISHGGYVLLEQSNIVGALSRRGLWSNSELVQMVDRLQAHAAYVIGAGC